MSAEVTLATPRLARPTLTRDERISAYLREDADLKSQVERLKTKRAALKELLKEIGEDAFELWYLQEHGPQAAAIHQRDLKRLARRAAAEEREQAVKERRANISPEAQAKLSASIEQLKARENVNGRRSVGKYEE